MPREHYLREMSKSFQKALIQSEERKLELFVLGALQRDSEQLSIVAFTRSVRHIQGSHSCGRACKKIEDTLVLWWKGQLAGPSLKQLITPQSQLCNILKTAIFAYFWNVKMYKNKRVSVCFLNKKEPKLIKMVVCFFLESNLVATLWVFGQRKWWLHRIVQSQHTWINVMI